jgi:ribosomal-protein-alanine N-acetyltransferase
MRIREMTVLDLKDVMDIEVLCFTTPWQEKAFENELTMNKLAHYFVLEESIDYITRVVAYIGCWHIVDEGHITNVAVHPKWRSKGYAKLLIQHLMNYAHSVGIEKLTLEVRVSNDAAISLYKSFGFVSHGIRPKYYSDTGEDALIMWAPVGGLDEDFSN